jgi:hypothetical protein
MIDKRWEAVQTCPPERLKTIGFGALRGKSDINPQWRIKAMTEVYGLCGIGWKYEIDNVNFHPTIEGKEIVFVTVLLFIKDDAGWSAPIYGVGGNMVIDKNKNGLVDNDEAVKMAVTDALGNAMKYIGVASQIYEGDFDGSKYASPKTATIDTAEVKAMYEEAVMMAEGLDDPKRISALAYIHEHKNDTAKLTAMINKMKEVRN